MSREPRVVDQSQEQIVNKLHGTSVEKFQYQGKLFKFLPRMTSSSLICRCSPITIHVPSQEFQHKKKCLFGNSISKKPAGGNKNKYHSLRKEDSLKLKDLLKQKNV